MRRVHQVPAEALLRQISPQSESINQHLCQSNQQQRRFTTNTRKHEITSWHGFKHQQWSRQMLSRLGARVRVTWELPSLSKGIFQQRGGGIFDSDGRLPICGDDAGSAVLVLPTSQLAEARSFLCIAGVCLIPGSRAILDVQSKPQVIASDLDLDLQKLEKWGRARLQ